MHLFKEEQTERSGFIRMASVLLNTYFIVSIVLNNNQTFMFKQWIPVLHRIESGKDLRRSSYLKQPELEADSFIEDYFFLLIINT